jgi:cardiolipin synthase
MKLTNFNSRSFSINDEADLKVYDTAFACWQIEIFENDLNILRRIALADWHARSWWTRGPDVATKLLESQL